MFFFCNCKNKKTNHLARWLQFDYGDPRSGRRQADRIAGRRSYAHLGEAGRRTRCNQGLQSRFMTMVAAPLAAPGAQDQRSRLHPEGHRALPAGRRRAGPSHGILLPRRLKLPVQRPRGDGNG